KSYREALRIWTTIADQRNYSADAETHIALLHRSIGDVLSEDQRHRDALPEYQSALDILKKKSLGRSLQTLILKGRIGTELAMLARADEGAEWSRSAVEEARALMKTGMNEESRHEVSTLCGRGGKALLRAGAIDAAEAMHREEMAMCENLVATAATEKNAHYRRDLALAYQNLGDVLLARNRLRNALGFYQQTQLVQEALLREDTANSQTRRELSATYSRLSEVLLRLGDAGGAERARSRDLILSERLLKDDPTSSAYR